MGAVSIKVLDWLKNPANQENVGKMADWLTNNAGKIFNGLFIIAGIDVVLGIKKGSSASNGSVQSPDFILTAEILDKD